MSDEDYAIFHGHVGRFISQDGCPICHTAKWQADGPFVMSMKTQKAVDAERTLTLVDYFNRGRGADAMSTTSTEATAETFAFVLLTCSTCFFTRQFAWLPIKGASATRG